MSGRKEGHCRKQEQHKQRYRGIKTCFIQGLKSESSDVARKREEVMD